MKKILLFCFLFLSIQTFADFPERPNPPRLVNDLANILNDREQIELEKKLVHFARETSTQIVLITVPSLDGYDKADYTYEIGERWGVGQKDKDNGIVMLIKPKQPSSKGQVFIATGYGLEGVLPDATVNGTVIDKEMIPRFKENDYAGGINAGLDVLMDIARGEYTAEQYQKSAESSGTPIPFIVIIIIFVIFSSIARKRRRKYYSPSKDLPWWVAASLLSGRGNRRGGWNDFSSGSGTFGGGGFGGFGGGSFGGGGAGGSW